MCVCMCVCGVCVCVCVCKPTEATKSSYIKAKKQDRKIERKGETTCTSLSCPENEKIEIFRGLKKSYRKLLTFKDHGTRSISQIYM